MRVFLSHTSRDKPLLREIMAHMPAAIVPWLDEDRLLLGDELGTSIKSAIDEESDFVVLFVSPESVESEWVLRELRWARRRERDLGRAFVLPVVLDQASWRRLPGPVRAKMYLALPNFSATAVRRLASELTDALLALAARRVSGIGGKPAVPGPEFVRGLAARIVDNQGEAKGDERLTPDTLSVITSLMDPIDRLDLLLLYELTFGDFRAEGEHAPSARRLDVVFRIGEDDWPREIEWTDRPFPRLHGLYGLGGQGIVVRDVFLEGLAALGDGGRLQMFRGIQVVRCELF